jgi:HTH-type transcriptional regulator, competence development regulator
MKRSLGETLRECRELMALTLRQVEEAAGISNAYLSQLENDKIKKPSANVLYKLSSLYKIELDALLYAAGIILEPPPTDGGVLGAVAGKTGPLTDDEQARLIEYLLFLRSQKKHEPRTANI